MRYKYVEELYPEWFQHGNDGDLVIAYNVAGESEIQKGKPLSQEDIEKLIKEHDRTVNRLCEVACAWSNSDDEAFTKFWYGEPRT